MKINFDLKLSQNPSNNLAVKIYIKFNLICKILERHNLSSSLRAFSSEKLCRYKDKNSPLRCAFFWQLKWNADNCMLNSTEGKLQQLRNSQQNKNFDLFPHLHTTQKLNYVVERERENNLMTANEPLYHKKCSNRFIQCSIYSFCIKERETHRVKIHNI